MVKESSPQAMPGAADRIALRPVGLDDWASVRYVHSAAFRAHANGHFTEAECDAFTNFVRSQRYIDRLIGQNVHAAWLDGELIGTSGWTPADDNGALARITAVFVRPLFTGMGIGRRLVLNAESHARAAGFERFSARVLVNAVGFFEKLGYDVTSHGVQTIGADQDLPITYMRKHAATDAPADRAAKASSNVGADGAAPEGEPPPRLVSLVTPRAR
jgi:GNAT superfamily N-acetyltransferase